MGFSMKFLAGFFIFLHFSSYACISVFKNRVHKTDVVKIKTLEEFALYMTQNLLLQEGQELLFESYKKNWLGGFDVNPSLKQVFSVLKKYPELSKPVLREQILTFPINSYEQPESIKQFIKIFSNSALSRRNNLFQIEANLGFWRKMLGFPEPNIHPKLTRAEKKSLKAAHQKDFLKYLNTVITENDRVFIKNPFKNYMEKMTVLYKALDKHRENLLDQGQDVHNISKAMVDLVDTAGFGNPHFIALLKSKDSLDNLEGVRKILQDRNISVQKLDIAWHFSDLPEFLGVKKYENYSTQVIEMEKNLQTQTITDQSAEIFRIRALSLQESPFRSCLSGDCATNTYFNKALDPNFLYFTLTDKNMRSLGHITVVLGQALNEKRKFVHTAFIDKIQNVPNHKIIPFLEGIRLSVKEEGYKLALPRDVGNASGLSNEDITRAYVKTQILPKLKTSLKDFDPHPNEYYTGGHLGFSQAGYMPTLLEFKGIKPKGHFQINPGEKHPPKLAEKSLSIKSLYKPVLNLKNSPKEESQMRFINNIPEIVRMKGLGFSKKQAKVFLMSKISNLSSSFRIRKQAFYTLTWLIMPAHDSFFWSAERTLDSSPEHRIELFNSFFTNSWRNLSKSFSSFSKKEQKTIIGEMSNWKESAFILKRNFIRNVSILLFLAVDSQKRFMALFDEFFGSVLDVNIIMNDMNLLYFLIKKNHKNLLENAAFLLEKGIDINHKTVTGHSVLMHLVKNLLRRDDFENIDVIEFFIRKGADVNAYTQYGGRLLSQVRSFLKKPENADKKHRWKKIEDLLVQNGAVE